MDTATRKDIDEVIDIVRDFMQQVDLRFTHIENEIVELKKSHNHLINTVDGFIARIDRYETELAARDSQFERLLAWARKVSKKTGIPLENL
jgi:archaellum component FlaC